MKKTFKVLIIPSSDDEGKFENADFTSALKISKSKQKGSSRLFEFNTEDEQAAFLQGYRAGIGYLGDGMYFTNNNR